MHLLEVLIAAALLATVLVSLPPAFASTVRANAAAADTTWTVTLAAQKVEELRSGPFPASGIDESFDFLDDRGRVVGTSGTLPAYVRTWRADPLPLARDRTIVIIVTASPYRDSASGGFDEAIPGAARLVTLRTRKAL